MIFGVIIALRIDQHQLVLRPRKTDHLGNMRKSALTIIGQDDHVTIVQERLVFGQFSEQDLVAWARLKINAHKLLLSPEHAQFDCRVDRSILVEKGINPFPLHQGL